MVVVPALTKSKADPSLLPCSLATTPDLHHRQSQPIIVSPLSPLSGYDLRNSVVSHQFSNSHEEQET